MKYLLYPSMQFHPTEVKALANARRLAAEDGVEVGVYTLLGHAKPAGVIWERADIEQPKLPRKGWSKDDTIALERYVLEGRSVAWISDKMKRTRSVIYNRIRRLPKA